MFSNYDRLLPGRAAKLALFIDVALIALVIRACWQDREWWRLWVLAAPAWAGLAVLVRVYSPYTRRTVADTLALLALVAAGATLFLHALVPWALTSAGPRLPYIAAGIFAATASSRMLFLGAANTIDRPQRRVLIVGSGPRGKRTEEVLTTTGAVTVVGFVSLATDADRTVASSRLLGRADELLQILNEHVVDDVYFAADLATSGREVGSCVRVCEELAIPFALPERLFRFSRAGLASSRRSSDGFLRYHHVRKPHPYQYMMKRSLDIMAAALALLLLLPVLLLVAIAIKLTSRGPVFYTQERVGLHGARFRFYKFRSMIEGADNLRQELAAHNERDGPAFKMRNDPRITPFGRFIRKHSIDELPQLLNVLRGDMSLVGPRPPLASEVAQYKPHQRRKLSVRPGLTCLWQVTGRDGVSFEEWMRMDLEYIDRWNLALDLRLIAQTLPVVVSGRGAS